MSPSAPRPPALDLSSTGLKSGPQSGGFVKVEKVGDRSREEIIDRDVYVNINADWVNAKGMSRHEYVK
jgi:hypothetical protein